MIYDYECDSCGFNTEITQSIKEEELTKCPECKQLSFRRLFSLGLGFYVENRTLGVVADKNTTAISSDQKHELNKKHKRPQTPEKPWYEKYRTKSSREVAKMSPQQKQDYIENG